MAHFWNDPFYSLHGRGLVDPKIVGEMFEQLPGDPLVFCWLDWVFVLRVVQGNRLLPLRYDCDVLEVVSWSAHLSGYVVAFKRRRFHIVDITNLQLRLFVFG